VADWGGDMSASCRRQEVQLFSDAGNGWSQTERTDWKRNAPTMRHSLRTFVVRVRNFSRREVSVKVGLGLIESRLYTA